MKPLFASALLSIATLAYPGVASASTSLSGSVVDENQEPVAGAIVTIIHMETNRFVYKTTNKQGRYRTDGLRTDGQTKIVVAHPSRYCSIAFQPSEMVGQAMKRNAVLCQQRSATPGFMLSSQWKQGPFNADELVTDWD